MLIFIIFFFKYSKSNKSSICLNLLNLTCPSSITNIYFTKEGLSYYFYKNEEIEINPSDLKTQVDKLNAKNCPKEVKSYYYRMDMIFKNATFNVDNAWNYFYVPFISLTASYIIGTIITPVLLPFIPTKNFSFKGIILALIFSVILLVLNVINISVLEIISFFFLNIAIASFTAMNFTGASTFTSLSGVKKEMEIAIPVQIILFVVGFVIWTVTRFI